MSSETEIQDVSGVTTQEKVEKFEPSSAWPSRAAEGASLDPRLLRQKVQGTCASFSKRALAELVHTNGLQSLLWASM